MWVVWGGAAARLNDLYVPAIKTESGGRRPTKRKKTSGGIKKSTEINVCAGMARSNFQIAKKWKFSF